MTNTLKERLDLTLKRNRLKQTWFHYHYVEKQTGLSYGAMNQQLNGYVSLSPGLEAAINKFLYDYEKRLS